jgi:uncharacterized protein YraI
MRALITRFTIILLVIILAISALPTNPDASPSAQAQGGVQATVIPDNLLVRSQPGTDKAIIDRFAVGTVLNVSGREDELGNGGIWVYAQPVGGGTQGWVLSLFLQFPSDFIVETLPVVSSSGASAGGASGGSGGASAPAGSLAAVTTNPSNFRSGPGTSFNIIRGLNAGENATVTGRTANNLWYRVNIGGVEGWLYYTLLDISGDPRSLPVVEGSSPTTSAPPNTGAGVPPPSYSSANLGTFSYGAHVAGFGRPDLMAYAGMSWAKKQIRYSPGQDPSSIAGIINDAHAKGFRILLGVVGYPNDVGGGEGYFQQFAGFVGGVAALGADGIEIWNEPNLDREWPHGQINPTTYTRLLALSYNSIKANNPGTIVISAALAPTGAEGWLGADIVWNDNHFLSGMRAAGAASYMDCVGAHYNEGIISPYQTSGDPRDGYYTRYLWGMINTYRGIMPKPICFTELGYLSPEGFGPLPGNFGWAQNTTVAQHALWVADAIRVARSSGTVRMVIIWNMDFSGYFGDDPMGGYALIRPDGSCPACDILASRR